MAFQLIKHIFNFFYPNETENQNDPDRPGPLLSFGDLIPCYDRSGVIRTLHGLDSPDLNQYGAEAYPVIDYILRSKKKPDGVGAYSIPFCGDISSHEYAKIARWFSENVPGASGQVETWLGGMPLVHAFTLVVAHRKASDFEKRVEARNEEWNDSMLLKMAWADLMISYPTNSFVADVDLECLTALEARMFEDSEEAGPAGNQQWGLDAGQHHRRWNVYL
ncbi:uncharacterized protein F5891DRAFT_1175109 [Suillus fuscotomentosus]|uniref:Uncharacterized protein n=1 Tax=Suillus fuscotomentosus TaxID=1912939 RepID=A0AAD4DZH3_9AGAM|nr:uncharacterized protein F5891DRAFT_1175109 [Suillus fuscotomentosus]KAG1896522.1 hypothetical protein F5891DRAFT_1175109 [Suillus fuscotomentosus]